MDLVTPSKTVEKRRRPASYYAEWRRTNPEKARAISRRQVVKRAPTRKALYEEFRAQIDQIKSAPCTDCGGKFPPVVMDFDHVRGPKKFEIGTAAFRPRTELDEELAKCDLVCAELPPDSDAQPGTVSLSACRMPTAFEGTAFPVQVFRPPGE